MKRLVLGGLPLLLLLAAPLQAQLPHTMRADIPFSFYVGDTQMAAGSYEIGTVMASSSSILRFRASRPGPAGFGRYAVRMGFLEDSPRGSNPRPRLVFHKYGADRYFISEVWGDFDGTIFPKSQREREVISSTLVAGVHTESVVIEARLNH